jgi:hypothetical protein
MQENAQMAYPPKLFSFRNPVRSADASSLSFSTPLGRLDLELEVGGVTIAPTATFTAGDRSVTVWSDAVWFEVLLIRAPISLPPGMAVAGAMAAVWRVDVAKSAVIKCRWASGATWSEVGPETGENLDAQTWTDGRTKVTVGLPDYETATTYRREGFEVAVDSIVGGQGHFICAWGPDSTDDISTWFAVDWPTERLIAGEAEQCVPPDGGGTK